MWFKCKTQTVLNLKLTPAHAHHVNRPQKMWGRKSWKIPKDGVGLSEKNHKIHKTLQKQAIFRGLFWKNAQYRYPKRGGGGGWCSVPNSSYGLIFVKIRAKYGRIFSKNTSEIRAKIRAKNEFFYFDVFLWFSARSERYWSVCQTAQ